MSSLFPMTYQYSVLTTDSAFQSSNSPGLPPKYKFKAKVVDSPIPDNTPPTKSNNIVPKNIGSTSTPPKGSSIDNEPTPVSSVQVGETKQPTSKKKRGFIRRAVDFITGRR
jgi:hypothetical protein